MKQNIFCIYRDNENLPYKIMGHTPFPADLVEGDRVCNFVLELDKACCSTKESNAVNIVFDETKEWFAPGTLFRIVEIITANGYSLVGSEQGYSYKKAKSIVKNLLIAYPNKKYKIIRKSLDKSS